MDEDIAQYQLSALPLLSPDSHPVTGKCFGNFSGSLSNNTSFLLPLFVAPSTQHPLLLLTRWLPLSLEKPFLPSLWHWNVLCRSPVAFWNPTRPRPTRSPSVFYTLITPYFQKAVSLWFLTLSHSPGSPQFTLADSSFLCLPLGMGCLGLSFQGLFSFFIP